MPKSRRFPDESAQKCRKRREKLFSRYLGAGCRGFESLHSDQNFDRKRISSSTFGHFLRCFKHFTATYSKKRSIIKHEPKNFYHINQQSYQASTLNASLHISMMLTILRCICVGCASEKVFALYCIVDTVFVVLYCLVWSICFKKPGAFRTLAFSILSSALF